MKRHTCIDRIGGGGEGGVWRRRCTGALGDAQYLSYIVFKSVARMLHETIGYDLGEIIFFRK